MTSLRTVTNGVDEVQADDLNQLVEMWNGTRNIPASLTGVNDPTNYALAVKNNDTASKVMALYKSDGTVLLLVDANGVKASIAGGVAATVVTTTDTQTLTSKTLASPVFTGVVKGQAAWFDPVFLIRI